MVNAKARPAASATEAVVSKGAITPPKPTVVSGVELSAILYKANGKDPVRSG